MNWWQIALSFGIPSGVFGLFMWWFKRSIDKHDTEKEERENKKEELMILIMQTSMATNVLAEATARAVQRIPDAHCNGDMKLALEKASKIQAKEQELLMDEGIKHIFE